MMPALSLLLTNYTMGSLPCGLGGYPHTPTKGMQIFLLTNFNLYYLNQSEMHMQTDAAPHIYYQINKNKNINI